MPPGEPAWQSRPPGGKQLTASAPGPAGPEDPPGCAPEALPGTPVAKTEP